MPGKIPPADPDGLIRLRQVVHDLRSPGGCPWDREQTHESLLPNLLEEAWEVFDAVRSGDPEHLCEELGDLLLQVVLHAEIAGESGAFNLDRIAHRIADKLIRRHPHVYGDSDAADTAAVLRQWDLIKQSERKTDRNPSGDAAPRGFLAGVGPALPALSHAAKLQKQAAKVGFDWPDTAAVVDKIREETGELSAALAAAGPASPAAVAEEAGDLLFSVVNLVRKLQLDPELVMADANRKFVDRFHEMERRLRVQGLSPESANLETMEAAWQAAKKIR
jgi:MazG family protein